MDLVRIRAEVRDFLGQYEPWRGRPIAVIRAGDVKLLRLVPVEDAPPSIPMPDESSNIL